MRNTVNADENEYVKILLGIEFQNNNSHKLRHIEWNSHNN